MIVPLATGQQIDYPYYGYYYGADVDSRRFVHEQPQEQVAHENQYADCTEHTAHEGFEPFDVDFFCCSGVMVLYPAMSLGNLQTRNPSRMKKAEKMGMNEFIL